MRTLIPVKDLLSVAALLLVAVLSVACHEDSTPSPAPEDENVIRFSTDVEEPTDDETETRVATAYDTSGGIPQDGSIGVYAYYHDNSNWATDFAAVTMKPNYMLNQQATNTQPGSYYSYSPLKYWPNESGDKVSFFAYFPYTASADDSGNSANPANPSLTGITPLLTENTAALPSYAFTVKDAPANQVDFLVSKVVTDRAKGSLSDRVHFQLWHATSKVLVSVIVTDALRRQLAYYKIDCIEFTHLYNTGTLSYTDGNTFGWGSQSGDQSYTFTQGEPQLLLPQTLPGTSEIQMDYSLTFNTDGTVYTYDGTGEVKATDKYTYSITGAHVQLNTVPVGSPITQWLPNHVYHYIIRLGADGIDFTATVVDWGEEVTISDINVEEPS